MFTLDWFKLNIIKIKNEVTQNETFRILCIFPVENTKAEENNNNYCLRTES